MQNTTRDRLVHAMDRAEADYLAAINAVARRELGATRRLAEAKVAMDDVGKIVEVVGKNFLLSPYVVYLGYNSLA